MGEDLKKTCSSCGQSLDLDSTEPCPKCGSTKKTFHKTLEARVVVTGRLTWQQVREYYEKRPLLLVVAGGITLGAPVLGLVLVGWVGLLVGVALGVVSFFVSLRAITNVREITKSH